MQIKQLILKNFRSYDELAIPFQTRLIFFIGENGAGKSNILESLSLLSFLKSFRGNPDEELVNWSKDHFFITASFFNGEDEHKLDYGFEKFPQKRKKIKLDGQVFKKQSEAYGIIPCIVLSPMDLEIVEGSHSERRKFIDSLLSFLNKSYLNDLTEYNKILKQRNSSLKKEIYDQSLFETWNKMLADKDDSIRNSRLKFIREFNEIFQKDLQLLSGERDQFQFLYKPNVNTRQEFESKIRENFPKDLRVGYTTVGCHRDEIFIGSGERDILQFASQGQRRSVVISLKTAAFTFLKRNLKTEPILLIDDVIRELDVKRREFFVDLIRGCGQAFFTTTDLEGIQDYIGNLDEPRQIFQIVNGTVQDLSATNLGRV
jgi:DNA replication and repair protein RecF